MRKSLLMQEYPSISISGIQNMKNIKTYFGSQLIDIEDTIRITDDTIIWSENQRQEQLGINEISKSETLYSIKNKYQTIQGNKTEFPTYNISIDVNSILIKYLFLMLKTNRTFEGIDSQNMDIMILDFINYNIFDRYRFKSVLLFIQYYQLDNNHLAYQTINDWNITWNQSIRKTDTELITSNISVKNFELTQNLESVNVRYKQTKSAKQYTFNYHYDLIFERI